MSRYEIHKEEWRPDGMDCQHPLCERFHTRGCPEPRLRTEWVIIDTLTGDRAAIAGGQTYSTKREAKAALAKHLA